MGDMSQVIVPKSDQKNAEDYLSGPRTYTIDHVEVRPGTEQPVSVWLVGEDRPWKPCKSMSRCLVSAWGADSSKYAGKSLTLYCDPKVKWGGMEVGGIRISHMSHIDRDMSMALTVTKGKRALHMVKVLKVADQRQEPAEDPATKWANGYIAKVEACHTIEDLAAFEMERTAKLTELGEKRPELHERCVSAAQARVAVISREGKPESDAGEDFTDEAQF